jgi:hypothetical protein
VDHLVDAAAWGVSFQIPKAIGGAGIEADAAVYAAGEVFVDRILARDGRRGSHLGLRKTVARRENDGALTFGRVSFWEEQGYTPLFYEEWESGSFCWGCEMRVLKSVEALGNQRVADR